MEWGSPYVSRRRATAQYQSRDFIDLVEDLMLFDVKSYPLPLRHSLPSPKYYQTMMPSGHGGTDIVVELSKQDWLGIVFFRCRS